MKVTGVDAALSKARAEELEHFAPLVDAARFGLGYRELHALLDDTDGLAAWRVIRLPRPIPARR